MLGSMSEQIRDCYEHAEECARKAAAQIRGAGRSRCQRQSLLAPRLIQRRYRSMFFGKGHGLAGPFAVQAKRCLGGTAETEVKARADAFCAGMIYLDWYNDRSPSGDASFH